MDLSLLTGKFFQAGYVVRDLEAGVEAMKAKGGVGNWQVMHLPAGSLIEGMAMAYVNGVMLELIAPDLANVLPVYQNHLPTSLDEVRFHHLGFMLDSEEEFNARIETSQAAGIGEAFKLDYYGVLTYYADSFKQIGHYCEFVYLTPPMRDFFANVPHN